MGWEDGREDWGAEIGEVAGLEVAVLGLLYTFLTTPNVGLVNEPASAKYTLLFASTHKAVGPSNNAFVAAPKSPVCP